MRIKLWRLRIWLNADCASGQPGVTARLDLWRGHSVHWAMVLETRYVAKRERRAA